MQVLFICSWKIDDVLTVSTVIPQLKSLIQLTYIDKITLVTLEDYKKKESDIGNNLQAVLQNNKLWWEPIITLKWPIKLVKQIIDHSFIIFKLIQIIKQRKISHIISYGSPAGALAYKLWKRTKLPFYVSSFEPHADYMADSGVWKKYGLKYTFQAHWENKQVAHAAGLMPVTASYTALLVSKGLPPEQAFTVPCTVNNTEFSFATTSRLDIRSRLGWHNATVGIYVGKFGDLYYNDEAFLIYHKCFNLIPNFRLIILTPQLKATVKKQLLKYQIDISKVYLNSVLHEQVSAYLSAADFAFATIKFYPSAKFCSPVKIGEYWANGLPVLLTEGVGDDSDIIRQEGGGALFNLKKEGSLEQAIQQIQQIIKHPAHRQEIPNLAHKYRSPDKIKEAYHYFFGNGE